MVARRLTEPNRVVGLAHRGAGVAVAAVLLVSCALAPLASSPSPAPGASSVPSASSALSPEPSLVATTNPTPTLTMISSPSSSTTPVATLPADLDLTSAAWFQWLHLNGVDGPSSLQAGRLDGRAFRVIDFGYPLDTRAALIGPVHGLVVINWADDNEKLSVDLIDTAAGSRTTIATGDSIGLGAIDPSATYVYWTTIDSGKMSGLWRRAVSGGPPEKILAGADVAGPFVDFSLDGKFIVLFGRHGDTGGWDYSVFDADLKPIGQLLDGRYGQVVGFLDDHRLVVGPPSTDELPPTVPLWALDVGDWSADKIITIDSEARVAIMPAADGTARLVFEGRDNQNRYTVDELDADGSTHVLFVGETLVGTASWDDLADAMVFPTTSRGVEAPGWLAVFPQARAMSPAALTGGDQGLRRLVRMSDGELVAIPSLTLTQ